MKPYHAALNCSLWFINFKSDLIRNWTGYARFTQGSSKELVVLPLLPRSHPYVQALQPTLPYSTERT
jgi:hypothetical protein